MYESLGATLHAMNQMQKRCPKCKKGRTCRVRINEKGFALFCSSCGYQAQAEDGTLIGAVRKATGTLPEAGYGESSPVSFAKLSQDGLWLKMCSSCYQTLLIENTGGGYSELFCETWPKWGIVLDGAATALRMLAASTKERESRLWPTPLASDGIAWTKNARLDYQISISRIIKRGGTLRAIYPLMFIGLSAPQCAELYEMMMGYPKGWTDLKLSETQLSLNNFTWYLKQLWKSKRCLLNVKETTAYL